MRKVLGTTAAVLAVVFVLGLGAGGWYYTAELLPAPQPEDPTYDVEVVAVDGSSGEVTLTASEGDLVELERLGFWTATATLELGEVLATDDEAVTRTATVLDGDWPEPGDVGTARATTFRGDPMEALGLPFEDVDVAGPDGVLPAWFVPGDDEADVARQGDVAVMVHGRGATREELHRTLRSVHAVGLDALVVSVRNDPEAPADPDGWGRFGDTEWEDLQAAVDHLVEQEGAERLVVVGSSQGASLTLGWLRRGEHGDRAIGAVLTSPLVSMHDTLVLQAQGRDIPDLAIPPLLWSTKIIATLRSGMRFHRLEHAADDVVDAYDVPMLVTHGTGDSTVPFDGSRQLADARPDLVQLEVYDDVEHVREWNADPDRFDTDLTAFLTSVLD
ncbi:alpha/beta hydrolase [Nitriliruptor alkaliphilus]|uniref:alpha/beta hydrolase n=1 Tax=Nitriliruptor alkaliphilus TaxID=427918 RepID=UPI000698F4A6|nr:alpha/beta hydrolase [Nitriliruptor alkaliphilus]